MPLKRTRNSLIVLQIPKAHRPSSSPNCTCLPVPSLFRNLATMLFYMCPKGATHFWVLGSRVLRVLRTQGLGVYTVQRPGKPASLTHVSTTTILHPYFTSTWVYAYWRPPPPPLYSHHLKEPIKTHTENPCLRKIPVPAFRAKRSGRSMLRSI